MCFCSLKIHAEDGINVVYISIYTLCEFYINLITSFFCFLVNYWLIVFDAEYLLLPYGFDQIKAKGKDNCIDCEKKMACVELNNG